MSIYSSLKEHFYSSQLERAKPISKKNYIDYQYGYDIKRSPSGITKEKLQRKLRLFYFLPCFSVFMLFRFIFSRSDQVQKSFS